MAPPLGVLDIGKPGFYYRGNKKCKRPKQCANFYSVNSIDLKRLKFWPGLRRFVTHKIERTLAGIHSH